MNLLPIMRSNVRFDEKTINSFGGINICESRKNGDLCESKNMCSENFPALSSRTRRSLESDGQRIINGTGSFEGYIYTSYTEDNKHIYLTLNGLDYEYTSYTDFDDYTAKRTFASLADSILIIPDNVIFYIKSKTFTKICVSQSFTTDTAREKYYAETNGDTELKYATLDNIASLAHNCITSRTRTYNIGGSKTFYFIPFADSLKAGDVINVKMNVFSASSDFSSEYQAYSQKLKSGITLKIKDVTKVTHTAPAGTITETTALIFEDNSINTGGYSDLRIRNISIERSMPSLHDICSFGNRIWAISGKEIFTSKLSDASEWNDFTTDSYGTLPYACFTTSAQTEGDFTAITPYGNYIYAFKENSIHKIYGDSPDEYTLHTQRAVGVGKNMNKCLTVCADSIIYASYDGVYRYSGDYPQKISENIGTPTSPVAAAANEEAYYLLCETDKGKVIYVYDLKKRLWHSQDADADSCSLWSYGNDIFLATQKSIVSLTAKMADDKYEKNVIWQFRMRIDDRIFGKKGYGKLSLRYSLGTNSFFTVQPHYDDGTSGAVCGAQFDEADSTAATLFLPIKRCVWVELEFKGCGYFMLKNINLKFYRGSEI